MTGVERIRFTAVDATIIAVTDRAVIFHAQGGDHTCPRSLLAMEIDRAVEALPTPPRGAEMRLRIMDWKAKALGLTEAPRTPTLDLGDP